MARIIEPENVEQLLAEGAEPVGRLVRFLPPVRGKARDPWTLVRWIKVGKDGPDGPVRLEGFTGPDGAWWSSRAALARFLSRLSGETELQTTAASAKRIEASRRALEKELGRKPRN